MPGLNGERTSKFLTFSMLFKQHSSLRGNMMLSEHWAVPLPHLSHSELSAMQAGDGEITANGKNLSGGRDRQNDTAYHAPLHFTTNANHQRISKLQKLVREWQSHAIPLKHSRICTKRRRLCMITSDEIASEIARSSYKRRL